MRATRGDAGDGRDMIGLERVLHAEQKTKPQNSEHCSPTRVIAHQTPSLFRCQVAFAAKPRSISRPCVNFVLNLRRRNCPTVWIPHKAVTSRRFDTVRQEKPNAG
jgi:hypothetical protein